MEELFEQLPSLRKKFETEQGIIGEIVKSEHDISKVSLMVVPKDFCLGMGEEEFFKRAEYTEEDVIEALREHPDLSADEWREKGISPSTEVVIGRFGSWNNAWREAGVPIKRKTPTP